jgi:hypothetical protein
MVIDEVGYACIFEELQAAVDPPLRGAVAESAVAT